MGPLRRTEWMNRRNRKRGTSPREHRAALRWQHRDAVTDSAVEQDLEVGGPETARTHDVATRRVLEPGTSGTAGRYRAVVIRCGCSRGKSFEGSCAIGKGHQQGNPLGGSSASGWKRSEPQGRLRVATTPAGCRCGVNRRSREERQGRNEFGGWHLRTEGRDFPRGRTGREWTRDIQIGGGAIFENQ